MSQKAELLVDASIAVGELHFSSSFTISRGELIAISGDIGSGKSALLRLVTGDIRAASGLVQFDNEYWDCTETGAFVPPEKRPIGYVPQDFRSAFDPEATALESLAPYKSSTAATALLHSLALGDHVIDRAMRTLSNGEAQRAALALALAKDPLVLLLDDPFSALDQYTSDIVHAWLDGWLAETGTPTIIVTQDEADQDHFVDRVIHLSA